MSLNIKYPVFALQSTEYMSKRICKSLYSDFIYALQSIPTFLEWRLYFSRHGQQNDNDYCLVGHRY